MFATMYKQMGRESAVKHRKFNSVLCDDLKGCDGGWDGRETEEGGDMCIHTANSLHCTAETNTILESNYTQTRQYYFSLS